jgi:hypothetical protein
VIGWKATGAGALSGRVRVLRALSLQAALLVVTLALMELGLRVGDLRYLRDGHNTGHALAYRYDPELGWFPAAHSQSRFTGSRSIQIAHNSLGLRDVELGSLPRNAVLFLGDSLVWGYDAEQNERFTERLRETMPEHTIVNAGVAGYGTDQEFLLLQRLWERIQPAVVVLIFCTRNDRRDNSTNSRYDGYYKPYLVRLPDGRTEFRGQPVPKSRRAYFTENWWAQNIWLVRVAISAYVALRHPVVEVPDPTEQLIDMMRRFVEARGAKFLVGLQSAEPRVASFLRAQKIPFASFDGAPEYVRDGNHWTPEGQEVVAGRLRDLFSSIGVSVTGQIGR